MQNETPNGAPGQQPPTKTVFDVIGQMFHDFLDFLKSLATNGSDDPRQTVFRGFVIMVAFLALVAITTLITAQPNATDHVYQFVYVAAGLFVLTAAFQFRTPPPGFAIAHEERHKQIGATPMPPRVTEHTDP